MKAPSPGARGSVTAVVCLDPLAGDSVKVLDALAPLSAELAGVVVRTSADTAQAPTGQAVHAGHPLHAQHGVEIVGVGGDLTETLDLAQSRTADTGAWLWLLAANSVPEPGSLTQMLRVAGRSSRVGIVGPKVVSTKDPRVLITLGQRISLWGRSVDDLNPVGWDQGQHDDRSDVVGVSLVGMLIRTDVLTEAGGVEASLDEAMSGLDLSWRVHLAGHRVGVAPRAVIRCGTHLMNETDHAPAETVGVRVARQRAWVALARGSASKVPGRAVGMLLTSLVAMMLMMVMRRPRAFALAWAEVSAVLFPWPALRARWRFRGRATVAERDLKELFLPHWATRLGLRWAPALADPLAPVPADGRRARDQRNVAALETGPVADEALSMGSEVLRQRRLWSWPLAVGLVVAVLAASVRWRELGSGLALSGWGVTSVEMGPVGADTAALFSSFWAGWTGQGLGQAGQGASWLFWLSGLAAVFEHAPGGPDGAHVAGVTTTWLLFASMPLSMVTAYWAARSLVWSRPIRAVMGLGWASASPLMVAVDTGRLGPVVVHVAAPLIVAGVVGSLQPGRRGTSAAFGVTALVSFVMWWVPLVGIFAVAIGLLVACVAPGWTRLRGLAIAGLPLVLLGPAVVPIVADPIRFLGGVGATAAGEAPLAAWQALLLHPGGPQSLSMWWVAPAWLLALAGVLGVRRAQGTGIALGLSIAGLLGVASAVVLSRMSLGQLPPGYAEAGLPITVWPGTTLSMAGACVLIAAGIGAAQMVPRIGAPRGETTRSARRAAKVTVLALTGAGVLGTLVVEAATGVGPTITAAPAPLPAVVAEQAAGTDRVRVITLLPDAADPDGKDAFGVRYDLGGVEPAAWLRDRAVDLALLDGGSASPSAEAGTAAEAPAGPVSEVVATLLDTSDAAVLDSAAAERALRDVAVAYIVVKAEQGHPLVAQLDQSPSLTRVSSTKESALWRVQHTGVASRAWTQSLDGSRQAMALTGSGARMRATVPPATTEVVISEAPEWAEQAIVRLDGELLSAEPGFPVRFPVAPGGGALVVEVPPPTPWWWWLTAGLFVLVLLLAIPFVGSRPRRMT